MTRCPVCDSDKTSLIIDQGMDRMGDRHCHLCGTDFKPKEKPQSCKPQDMLNCGNCSVICAHYLEALEDLLGCVGEYLAKEHLDPDSRSVADLSYFYWIASELSERLPQ